MSASGEPRIVPADLAHVVPVALRMRQADRDEIWAAGRWLPVEALVAGFCGSSHVWTGLIGDAPVCMFGVAPTSLLGGAGRPWLLGTDAVEQHQVTFLRRCRPAVAAMRAVYDSLENWVDDRNEIAQRWLRWLGFTIEAPRPFGPEGEMFRRFTWRREDV